VQRPWLCGVVRLVYLGDADGVQGLGLQLLGDVGDGVGHHHGAPVEGVLHGLPGQQ